MGDLLPARSRIKKCMRIGARTYLVLVLAAWILLYAGGDRWLPATLLLFGPRWLLSLPLVLLVPLSAWCERRQLMVLAVAAVITFGPVMHFCVPFVRAASESSIRILTCNVGGPGLDTGKLRRLIQESAADIVALQECPREIAASMFPGWSVFQEQSLVIASRFPIAPGQKRQAKHPPHAWPRFSLLQCRIDTPEGELSFCSVHLPSPRYGLSSLLDRRVFLNPYRAKMLNEERELRRKTSREIEGLVRTDSVPVIVAGDFNMPVESAWYRESWADYSNAFSKAGFGYGFTEKIEMRGFQYKVRIDHILTRGRLQAAGCRVGPDVGSDHLPLIADIDRKKE